MESTWSAGLEGIGGPKRRDGPLLTRWPDRPRSARRRRSSDRRTAAPAPPPTAAPADRGSSRGPRAATDVRRPTAGCPPRAHIARNRAASRRAPPRPGRRACRQPRGNERRGPPPPARACAARLPRAKAPARARRRSTAAPLPAARRAASALLPATRAAGPRAAAAAHGTGAPALRGRSRSRARS